MFRKSRIGENIKEQKEERIKAFESYRKKSSYAVDIKCKMAMFESILLQYYQHVLVSHNSKQQAMQAVVTIIDETCTSNQHFLTEQAKLELIQRLEEKLLNSTPPPSIQELVMKDFIIKLPSILIDEEEQYRARDDADMVKNTDDTGEYIISEEGTLMMHGFYDLVTSAIRKTKNKDTFVSSL